MRPSRWRSDHARSVQFVSHLTELIEAGLTIPRALALLAEDARRRGDRDRLAAALAEVEAGADLSAALAAPPALVDRATEALVVAGERSGLLVENLRTARRMAEDADRRRRRLRSAAVYPLVVTLLAIGLAVGMTLVVLPRLAATYASLGGELPALTRGLLAVSAGLTLERSLIVVAGAAVVAVGLRARRGRRDGTHLLDAVPVVRGLRRDLRTTVALEVISSLLRGGVALVDALDTAGAIIGHPWSRVRLERIAEDVRAGRDVGAAVAASGLVPTWVVETLVVGDRTGGLVAAFGRAATTLGGRAEERAQDVATALEPALLAAAGAVVGTVVVALYLPLFRVVDLIR
jgi:type IV pilus assembly protein PilC